MNQELLEEMRQNYFIDESNLGIVKEHYKEEGFTENIYSKVERNEFYEEYFDECLNTIKPLLNNKNLVICNTPIVRYKTNSYAVIDIVSIETINQHLNKGEVLLYCPIIVNGILKYKANLL
jgi:hypothetical protein